jgi:hypothetical protein
MVPLVALPVEKPVPTQEVAFVDDQWRHEELPTCMDDGVTVNEAVGATALVIMTRHHAGLPLPVPLGPYSQPPPALPVPLHA